MTGARRVPWLLLAATALAVTTACGSTVQQNGGTLSGGQGRQAGGTGGAAGNGLGGPAGPGAGGTGSDSTGALSGGSTGGAPGVGGAGGTTGTTTGSTSTGQGPTTTSGGASTSGGSSVEQGPGITATTISVGLPYITNGDAAGKAVGITGAGGGDQRAQWNVVINDINKHRGGILGRKIVPVFHPTDATSAESYDAQEQAACSDYHEDHKVFAVLDNSVNGVLQACTEKARAVMASETASLSYSSVQTFSRYPHYVEVGKLRLDRLARNWPGSLNAQKYFTGWNTSTGTPGPAPVKVGILYLDDPASTYSVKNVLIPGLAALGQRHPDVVQVQSPKSTSDNGSTISAIQAAVLKFRSDGVTHFLPLDPGGGVGLFFAENAENQKYYPRYGLTTSNGAQLLRDLGGVFPEKQLHGSLGYGWVPVIDLSASRDPDNGPNSNEPRRTCLKLMKDGGQNLAGAVQVRSAIEVCDSLSFLKATLEGAGPSITQATFLAGVNRLGGSFVAGNTFSTGFGPRQHDGVTSGRLFAYDQTCSCFNYTSGLRTLS